MSFGVDDLDGTIDDTTKIYSMAGSEEQNPSMSTYDLVTLIKNAGRVPVERDTLYHELKDWSAETFESVIKAVNRNKRKWLLRLNQKVMEVGTAL